MMSADFGQRIHDVEKPVRFWKRFAIGLVAALVFIVLGAVGFGIAARTKALMQQELALMERDRAEAERHQAELHLKQAKVVGAKALGYHASQSLPSARKIASE
jgi:hypothetical protein